MTTSAYNKSTTAQIERDLWRTPKSVIDAICKRFGFAEFDMDLCADEHNKHAVYYCDALERMDVSEYAERAWMNPPFSAKNALSKLAVDYVRTGMIEQLFLLLPDKPETKLFAWLEERAQYVCRFNKRIEFLKPSGERAQGAPFGSVVFVFTRYALRGMCQQVRIEL